jgi:hypothetical protein
MPAKIQLHFARATVIFCPLWPVRFLALVICAEREKTAEEVCGGIWCGNRGLFVRISARLSEYSGGDHTSSCGVPGVFDSHELGNRSVTATALNLNEFVTFHIPSR